MNCNSLKPRMISPIMCWFHIHILIQISSKYINWLKNWLSFTTHSISTNKCNVLYTVYFTMNLILLHLLVMIDFVIHFTVHGTNNMEVTTFVSTGHYIYMHINFFLIMSNMKVQSLHGTYNITFPYSYVTVNYTKIKYKNSCSRPHHSIIFTSLMAWLLPAIQKYIFYLVYIPQTSSNWRINYTYGHTTLYDRSCNC
jgi:hypothetical protein